MRAGSEVPHVTPHASAGLDYLIREVRLNFHTAISVGVIAIGLLGYAHKDAVGARASRRFLEGSKRG